MEHYKSVVLDFLQADRALFVNSAFCTHLGTPEDPEKQGQRWSCDAIAIDLRHGAVYVCQTVCEDRLQPLIRRLSTWTRNWELIKTALRRDSKVPAKWRVHVWLFAPKALIELLDEELEHLRNTIGSKFKVKITALEDVQPWRASNWERCEAAWETSEQQILI